MSRFDLPAHQSFESSSYSSFAFVPWPHGTSVITTKLTWNGENLAASLRAVRYMP